MALFTTAGVATALGISATSFAAAAAATALNVVVGVGFSTVLSVATSALMGQPDVSSQRYSVRGTLQLGAEQPRSIMLGQGATAGSLVWANTWTDNHLPNDLLTQVICLSDYPVRSLRRVFVNDEPVTLSVGDDPDNAPLGKVVTEYNVGLGPYLWVRFYDGTQTTADPLCVSQAASTDRPYESTRVGVGCAYAVVTARVNRELFTGVPKLKFELDGAKIYDITKDSTAGGSGLHRWDDVTTWGGDGDYLPAVQAYNILRGVTLRGVTAGGDWLYGLQQISAAQLPATDWIAEVNKCRATITEDGGALPTYQSGGEFPLNEPASDAIKQLLTASNGRFSEAGGVYRMHVGAPGAAVYSITDDDIISTAPRSFVPFRGLAQTINGIAATYPSPAQAWNLRAAPPLIDATLEAQDGGRRLPASVTYAAVWRDEQVQRLNKAALDEARRDRRHTFTLGPEAWALELGDVISWTSERNGYTTKAFRVDGIVDQPNGDVVLDVTETDPVAGTDWDTGAEFTPVPDGPLAPVRPASAATVISVSAAAIGDGSISRRAAIAVGFTPPSVEITAIAVQVRLDATNEVVSEQTFSGLTAGAATTVLISEGILDLTDYEVRAIWRGPASRSFAWSPWAAVTTGDYRLTADDLADVINTAISDNTSAAAAAQADASQAIADAAAAQLDASQLQTRVDKIEVTYSGPNIIRTRVFEDGAGSGSTIATWTASTGTLSIANNTATAANWGGLTKALRLTGTEAAVMREPRAAGDANGRSFRIRGRAFVANSVRSLAVGVDFERPDGTFGQVTAKALTGGVSGVQSFDVTVTVAQATVAFGPLIRDNGGTPAQSSDFQVTSLSMVDDTEAQEVDAYFRQSTAALAADGLAIAQSVNAQGVSIGDIQGDITTIQTNKVDAAGAVSAVDSAVNAVAGASYATIAALTATTADIEGNATASHVLRATTKNAEAVFELVAFDNADGGAASAVRLAGDFITLDGDTEVKGDFRIEGDLIVSGTVDAPQLAIGSVAGHYIVNAGDTVVTSTPAVVLASASVPAVAGETVAIIAKADALNDAAGAVAGPAFLSLVVDSVVQDSGQTPVGINDRSTLVASRNFVAPSTKSYAIEIRGRFNAGDGGRFMQPKLMVVRYR